MKTYNHMYTIAFELISENDGEDVTEQEILDALGKRLQELARTGTAVEAVGMPDDTFVEEE